ncbi:sensor domain-containing phosphodiesterase [Halomonas daqiaonensis]|uniref:EAL domain, c-di-GMP-specific phosphodiesterase class I (Or its enzymatically inactive variant) n=1 Tax=Halomonas daqiaonensis TaxID=650850 RepID=A0A1H7QWA6_9GAMM|nr:EAL domain-containing protein [Halomonas daqiaonensis]SEL52159.1 EAL domain, c-di-GMP-specific phosphodiesterase class I (or its enzymatically inactive variant) [Halomonas daqiaonensis]
MNEPDISFTQALDESSTQPPESSHSPEATRPRDEKARLAELHSLDILDTSAERYFDRYTHLVAEIFKVPMVAVSLVDEDRQWFKSSIGMEVCETPLEESFCVHAIEEQEMLEVPDALEDDVFRDHPAVVGSPHIRFYMGTVLRGPTGQPLGTLCIMDTHSRYLTRAQRTWLVTFGHLVEELINHDHALTAARQQGNQNGQRNTRTGLPDETLFGDTLTHLLRMSEKEGHYLAVLHLRLNRVDEISRVNGRRTRDAILHALAERLTATDIKVLAAGHLSKARFGAVVPLHSVRDLFDVITPIVNKLSGPIKLDEVTIRPDIDVGISLSPLDGLTPEDLLERARAALSGPKSHEGVHVFSHEAEETALRRHTIEQFLEPALLENRLIKHYQPLVATDGSRIVGFEALARWQHDELGSVSPGDFVPIAEKNARLSRLMTEWSIRTVCERAPHWPIQPSDAPLRIAINIPAGQFYQQDFLDRVLRTLEEHELAPERLTLELTEESLLANVDKAIQTMRELRRHKITVALDDFGTGYSSLSYLKSLPIDTLKIDKSFIDDLPNDSRAVDLVDGIIRIAHGLELQVVAEGVEHESQRTLLHQAKCDVVQGYLFSRPLLADDALALLKSWPQVS